LNPTTGSSNKPRANRSAGRRPNISSPGKPSSAQPKTTIASHMKKQPVAPPVYRPQPAPKAMQPKMRGSLLKNPPPSAPPINRSQPALQSKRASGRQPAVKTSGQPVAPPMSRTQQMTGVLQPKFGARPSTVIQLKNCLSCHHTAHTKACKVQVAAANGKTKKCGCKSHSIKFDSGQKFNPKGGKRERMLANKGSV
jgi:hypothetical protein